jgi:hypothetical protein
MQKPANNRSANAGLCNCTDSNTLIESAVSGGFGFLLGFFNDSASTIPFIIGEFKDSKALSRPKTDPAKAMVDLAEVKAPADAPTLLKKLR